MPVRSSHLPTARDAARCRNGTPLEVYRSQNFTRRAGKPAIDKMLVKIGLKVRTK